MVFCHDFHIYIHAPILFIKYKKKPTTSRSLYYLSILRTYNERILLYGNWFLFVFCTFLPPFLIQTRTVSTNDTKTRVFDILRVLGIRHQVFQHSYSSKSYIMWCIYWVNGFNHAKYFKYNKKKTYNTNKQLYDGWMDG